MSKAPRAMMILSFLTLLFGWTPTITSAASCQFVLGFKTLHDLIPSVVGDCLEDQHSNAVNGDALQSTTGGLLVWRKLDNWTAFTDGYHTWVNGPYGLQERLNTERFVWELTQTVPAPAAPPTATPAPAAPPSSPTPSPASGAPTATPGPAATVVATPSSSCSTAPSAILSPILSANSSVATKLGCPTAADTSVQLAWQLFQGGSMLWRGDTKTIYGFLNTGTYTSYADTYAGETLPVSVPPAGLFAPERGFGKVWQGDSNLQTKLGWATQVEHGLSGGAQNFANGTAVWTTFDNYTDNASQNVFILYTDGTWWGQMSSGFGH